MKGWLERSIRNMTALIIIQLYVCVRTCMRVCAMYMCVLCVLGLVAF